VNIRKSAVTAVGFSIEVKHFVK